ncbi:MAG: tetraacyldisaccharide 4'-kinase [Flavobacteriales bacterium]|nr:tetraacyldisaccharide 4'-kinase [Flavobacteriales bacterium]
MIKTFKILLLPFSLVYGSILYVRNKLYDWNILKTISYEFPVISIGNLALGGTGKTPHIEYLIRLLQKDYKIAILSRGYKRTTKGFLLADENSNVSNIGDEPLQYKLKFKKILVAVDEKRVHGINKIKKNYSKTDVILLDDAYQHRSVNPNINILITEYNNLYINDTTIPAGRLREWGTGSKRADIIIVSKTKNNLTLNEKEKIISQINPLPHQKVYFSFIKYEKITSFTKKAKDIEKILNLDYSVLLLTGIAKPTALFNTISNQYKHLEHIKFSDHHNFKNLDILKIKDAYKKLKGNNKIIISTEKDIMRLSLPKILNQLQDIPIFYIPIEICFHGNDQKDFDNQILKYVTKNSRN